MGIKPKSFVMISSASVAMSVAMFCNGFSELRTAPGGIPAVSVMVAICELEWDIAMEVEKPKGGHETMGDGVGWVLHGTYKKMRAYRGSEFRQLMNHILTQSPNAAGGSPPK
jgi:hypothetical protein